MVTKFQVVGSESVDCVHINYFGFLFMEVQMSEMYNKGKYYIKRYHDIDSSLRIFLRSGGRVRLRRCLRSTQRLNFVIQIHSSKSSNWDSCCPLIMVQGKVRLLYFVPSGTDLSVSTLPASSFQMVIGYNRQHHQSGTIAKMCRICLNAHH